MKRLKKLIFFFIILGGLFFIFGLEVIPESLHPQEFSDKVAENDVIIIFNSGGWGDSPFEDAKDFTPIIEGIQKTLNEWGYNSVVIPYNRTRGTLSGRIAGTKEFFNSFNFSSEILAKDLEVLIKDLPDKKIIIAGLSNGGTFVTKTYEKISEEFKDSVYGITVGTPFWARSFESDNLLQLDNNGKDNLAVGNVRYLFLSLIKTPLRWISAKLNGQNLTFSQAFHTPGHYYFWSSPELSSQIVTFLENKFKKNYKIMPPTTFQGNSLDKRNSQKVVGGKFFVGTSGWVYSHWDGVFYPEDLPSKDKLKYFSHHFKTIEINYSFYRLPRQSTYQNWYKQTPEDFLFAVKASRFITHIKRLKEIKEAWNQFRENAKNLKEKLGPILFQFPPNFRANENEVKRLEVFLKLITKNKLRYAFEFRHKSWCDKKVYQLLKKYKVAWVIADSPSYPKAEEVTADFVYIRMHGSKVLFSSNYTKKELKALSQKIKKWLKQNKDVYVYFNNDAMGYAVENAKELLKLCKS